MLQEKLEFVKQRLTKIGSVLPVVHTEVDGKYNKAPSVYARDGGIQKIQHKKYNQERPSTEKLTQWFKDERITGVGIKPLDGYHILDIDAKNFESQADCDRYTDSLLEMFGETYVERSTSGGFHVYFKHSTPLGTSGSYKFASKGKPNKCIGEILGSNNFAVCYPTDGYTVYRGSIESIVEIPNLQKVGVVPYKEAKKEQDLIYEGVYEGQTSNSRRRLNQVITQLMIPHTVIKEFNQLMHYGKIKGEVDRSEVAVNVLGVLLRSAYARLALFLQSDDITAKNLYPHMSDIELEAFAKLKGKDVLTLDNLLVGIREIVDRDYYGFTVIGVFNAFCNLLGEERVYKICEPIMQSLSDDGEELSKLANWQGRIKGKGYEKLDYMVFLESIYAGRIRLNEMGLQPEVDGVAKDLDTELEETHKKYSYNPPSGGNGILSLMNLAKGDIYHPVADKLEEIYNRLKDEPEISNPHTFFEGIAERLFGAKEEIYDLYFKKSLIAAVSRLFYDPVHKNYGKYAVGHHKNAINKVDTCLVLQGKQGLKKSTAAEMLGLGYSDTMNAITATKDDYLNFSMSFIVEIQEIDRFFRKTDQSQIKALLSTNKDTFRPPYEKAPKTFWRKCTFWGSTNDDEFLVDDTGSRRYWVIPVSKVIPANEITESCEYIWAAAMKLFDEGFPWWLSDDEDAMRRELNQNYQSRGVLESRIIEYCVGNLRQCKEEGFQLVDVGEFIGFSPRDMESTKTIRSITNILKEWGCTQKRPRNIEGVQKRVWYLPQHFTLSSLDPDLSSKRPQWLTKEMIEPETKWGEIYPKIENKDEWHYLTKTLTKSAFYVNLQHYRHELDQDLYRKLCEYGGVYNAKVV